MEYPIRAATHEIESESWKVLITKTPSAWVVRQVSERDYGVDFYAEIANEERQITGEVFSGQLKGTTGLSQNADGTATWSGIKHSTINYWMGLPMPVFLFVTDLTTSEVWYSPVKQHVRRNYSAFKAQKTLGFSLTRVDLRTQNDQGSFLAHYFREKHFDHFHNYLRELLMRWQELWDFIQANQMRDVFLCVEDEIQLQFIQLYRSLEFLASAFEIGWSVQDLSRAFEGDRRTWKEDWCDLHEETLDRVLKQIEPIFISVFEAAVGFVYQDEGAYWAIKEPTLWRLTQQLRHTAKSLRDRLA
ncbi:MAG TPA: DUF4365 domain-containing protein [Chthoniobacterales bacterium]|nr:DUF4365 domain-containing protein [Chthoniobacterales bacterium]